MDLMADLELCSRRTPSFKQAATSEILPGLCSMLSRRGADVAVISSAEQSCGHSETQEHTCARQNRRNSGSRNMVSMVHGPASSNIPDVCLVSDMPGVADERIKVEDASTTYSLMSSLSLPSSISASTSLSLFLSLSTAFSTLCSIGKSPAPSQALALLMMCRDRRITSSSAFLIVPLTLTTLITTGISRGLGRWVIYVRAAQTIP